MSHRAPSLKFADLYTPEPADLSEGDASVEELQMTVAELTDQLVDAEEHLQQIKGIQGQLDGVVSEVVSLQEREKTVQGEIRQLEGVHSKRQGELRALEDRLFVERASNSYRGQTVCEDLSLSPSLSPPLSLPLSHPRKLEEDGATIARAQSFTSDLFSTTQGSSSSLNGKVASLASQVRTTEDSIKAITRERGVVVREKAGIAALLATKRAEIEDITRHASQLSADRLLIDREYQHILADVSSSSPSTPTGTGLIRPDAMLPEGEYDSKHTELDAQNKAELQRIRTA
ncbi:hypothetical protein KIPB_010331, partial [Kipferlia bialata]|eukprot:g10331.t1